MDWLTKNELIPHGDSRLTRRGGFDPLWRIGITILIIYPRVSPAANQDWTHLRRVHLTRKISLHLSSILIQIQYTRMFLVTDPPQRIKPCIAPGETWGARGNS